MSGPPPGVPAAAAARGAWARSRWGPLRAVAPPPDRRFGRQRKHGLAVAPNRPGTEGRQSQVRRLHAVQDRLDAVGREQREVQDPSQVAAVDLLRRGHLADRGLARSFQHPLPVPEAQRANAAPPVLQFNSEGKLLTSWGGPGNGAEWIGREHGIFVDANDFVWIGGRAGWPRATTPGVSDDMIMKFTMTGERVMQIGRSGQSTGNLDTENVHQATDVFVDTQAKEIYAADGYGNKRVIVFDSETGKFKRMWGAFGNPPPSTFAPNAPAPQPQTTPDGPPEFGLPTDQGVARRVVYLADRINNRIQMFTREGKFLKQVRVTNEGSTVVPVPAGFAFSPDRDRSSSTSSTPGRCAS